MDRLAGIAERILTAYGPSMPRDFYLPRGEHVTNLQKITPEGTDVEAYTYEDTKGQLYGIAFAGKGNKPLWHYRFRSEADRQRRIDETVEDRKGHAESVEQRRQERLQYRHGLKVGDILVSSWGYDQTNIDWYEVIDVGEKSVRIREIEGRILPSDNQTQDKVVPALGHFKGPVMTKIVGPGDVVRISSFARAYKWKGEPQYQTAFGYGH